MGKRCHLKNCDNAYYKIGVNPHITYHSLPKSAEFRRKWLEAIPAGLLEVHRQGIYICSEHFTPDCFQPNILELTKRMLRRTAVPSIFDDKQQLPLCDLSEFPTQISDFAEDEEIDSLPLSKIIVIEQRDATTQTVSCNIPTAKEMELKRTIRNLQKNLRTRGRRIELLRKSKGSLTKRNAQLFRKLTVCQKPTVTKVDIRLIRLKRQVEELLTVLRFQEARVNLMQERISCLVDEDEDE